MFVRKKTDAKGVQRHYLVKSHREGGKVRQKVLLYLGHFATVEEALAGLEDAVRFHREKVAGYRKQAEAWYRNIPADLIAQHKRESQLEDRRFDQQRKVVHLVPRPHLSRMAPVPHEILSEYWKAMRNGNWHDRRAMECAAHLERLRVLVGRSAQNWAP